MRNRIYSNLLLIVILLLSSRISAQDKPNVIIIYTDDLGYGDLSCYGATKLQTPHLDKLAATGLRFTNGRSTSATCTPSRYALMTGKYPWRRKGTGVLPGDAALIVPTDKITLPKVFKAAGYQTAIVGKWHLGLGTQINKNWNDTIMPGPNDVGFDYSFIFPATADRVPTVFLENQKVIALDKNDPIQVDYEKRIGNEPTGKDHPELLKMLSSPDHGHNQTIVNGIGRIGYMQGGKMSRWTDEEMPLTFLIKAREFISARHDKPFFLYYALTEPHVPRVPSTMFKGKSGLGVRGDVILQLDWTVGQIMEQLKTSGLDKNTMIVFSSDNGPVLDDGYQDESVTRLNGHNPMAGMRGGKYSMLEAATRIPLLINWPEHVQPGVSDALVCQIDFVASFAKLLGQPLAKEMLDSQDLLTTFLGRSKDSRTELIVQGQYNAIIKDGWKYIPAGKGEPMNKLVHIETGVSPEPQLYDLKNDPAEQVNLAIKNPLKLKQLADLMTKITSTSFD